MTSAGRRARPPAWRRVFDRVERAVGAPLEDAAGSEAFVDVMVRGLRVQRAIGTGFGRIAGGAVSKVLHVAGLPTRGDVRSLGRQLTTLTGEVRAIKAAVAEAERRDGQRPVAGRGAAGTRGPDDAA
jgi:hypothetical protein